MKRALSIAAQCILFMLTFLVGSLAPSLHLIPMERLETSPAHYFVLDGLFCMGLLYIIFLIIAAVTRRLPRAAINTTLALLIALVLGLLMKFPFMAT
jgi:hypothetical protein